MSTRRLASRPQGQSQASCPPKPTQAAPVRAFWLVLPTGLGAGASLAYLSHDLGVIVALTEVMSVVVIALVLLIAILCGSKDTCERAFRLLRWAANRPEPPRPRCRKQ